MAVFGLLGGIASPGVWRIAGAVAAVAALGLGVYAVWSHGHSAGYSKARAEVQESTDALNSRLTRSREALRSATEAFERQRSNVESLREALSAARSDPDAARRAFGSGSVSRIGSFR